MIKRTLFTPVDSLVFLLGILCIFFGIYLYQKNSFDQVYNQLSKPVGVHLSGKGTQKNLGNLFWSPLLEKSNIYNGDKLFANNEENVKVQFAKSGIIINIEKDSLVVIYEEEDSISFSLDKGTIQVSSSDKNAQIKIKDQSGDSRVINLNEKSELDIKKSKGSSDISIKSGQATLLGSSAGVIPKLVEEPKKAEVLSFVERNIIDDSQIDRSKKKLLAVEGFKSNKLQVYKSLNQAATGSFPVTNGKLDISSLPPGEYFVKEEGGREYDRIKVIESNSFVARGLNNQEELQLGTPLEIEWDGLNDADYNVLVIPPSGPMYKLEVKKSAMVRVVKPVSGEYKVYVSKVDAMSKYLHEDLYFSDRFFRNSLNSFDRDFETKKSKREGQRTLVSKDRSLTFGEVREGGLSYKFTSPNLSVESTKTSGREQISKTQITSGRSHLEIVEDIDQNQKKLKTKKAKFEGLGSKEELTFRYDELGVISAISFHSGESIVEQRFENGKLVSSREGNIELKGSDLVKAVKLPRELTEYIHSKFSFMDENLSSIKVSVQSAGLIIKSEDLVDTSDDYLKKLELRAFDNISNSYILEDSKGKIVSTFPLKTSVFLKNYEMGIYTLKLISADKKSVILSEEVLIKPRIEILTKVEDLDYNEKEKKFIIGLKWNSPSNENKVEIYKENKKTPVMSQVVKGKSFNYKTSSITNLKWRVLSLSDGVISSKTVEVAKVPILKKLPLSPPIVMKYRNKLGGCYEFEIPKIKYAKKYFVEVYEGADRSKMIFNRWLNENDLCWQSSKQGNYFYRYKYFDFWGMQSDFSEMGEIIFPISPMMEF